MYKYMYHDTCICTLKFCIYQIKLLVLLNEVNKVHVHVYCKQLSILAHQNTFPFSF